MITFTKEQLTSEYLLCNKKRVCLVMSTSNFKKYIKMSRIGQNFTVNRQGKIELFKALCEWNRARIDFISKKHASGFDYEGAILDQQEMRDYN